MAYDYPTNFSNGTNSVTNLGSFIQYGDYLVSGALGIAFLALIFITALIMSMALGVKKALLSSSFITLVFSVYFLRLEMVSPIFVFGLLIFVIFVLVFPDKQGGQS